MESKGGIYKIQNTVNGKRYIGSAVRFAKRWKEHRADLRSGQHHSRYLQRAWNKYGEAAFEFVPLLICAREDLIPHEQLALDGLQPEYNMCFTAGSSLGIKHTPEAKAKMSAAQTGRKHTAATKAKMSAAARGIPKSAEHRAKLSAVKLGRSVLPRTPEFKAALSARMAGNKYAVGNQNAKGVKKSPANRAAISSRMAGKKLPPAWRAAIGAGNRGRVVTQATREKIAASRRGIKCPAVAEANRRRAGEKRGATL